jgi:hypothetical protein
VSYLHVFAMLLKEVVVQSERATDITSLKDPVLIKLLISLTTLPLDA